MHIYKEGARSACLADCGEDGNHVCGALETAAGMRPQLCKEGRKTVPNSGTGMSANVWTDSAPIFAPCDPPPFLPH